MPAGKVYVDLGWAELSQDSDARGTIKKLAIEEIRYRHNYADDEIRFVDKDEVLSASVEKAYRTCRERAYAFERRNGKLSDKGKDPSNAPLRWKTPIHYSRPGTRGMFDRMMKE